MWICVCMDVYVCVQAKQLKSVFSMLTVYASNSKANLP
jgi:hypothetical protein